MKKFLYFFGILALIAGLVSSCSKDEDEGGNDNSNPYVPQKKIVKVIDIEDDTTIFNYDENKKLSFSSSSWMGKTRYEKYYTWEGNNVIEKRIYKSTFWGDETSTVVYTHNSKGYLESGKYEGDNGYANTLYKYDSQGHLISEIYSEDDGYTYTRTFEWENGNITKITGIEKRDNEKTPRETITMIVKYTSQKNPLPIKNVANLSIIQIEPFDFALFHPIHSKTGVATKNLPVYVSYTEIDYDPDTDTEETETEEEDIEWEMDNDGFPTKKIHNDGTYQSTTEIFWE